MAIISDLVVKEHKGDVTFLEDGKGNLYQSFGKFEPYKVRDGSITYKEVAKLQKNYSIKYNNNGMYGFAIFKGTVCLEDNYWVYFEARKKVDELIHQETK